MVVPNVEEKIFMGITSYIFVILVHCISDRDSKDLYFRKVTHQLLYWQLRVVRMSSLSPLVTSGDKVGIMTTFGFPCVYLLKLKSWILGAFSVWCLWSILYIIISECHYAVNCWCCYWIQNSKYLLLVETLNINHLSGAIAERLIKHIIDPLHRFYNAPVPYPTIHHFVTEMCAWLHIPLQNGALWDICLLHCGICEMGRLVYLNISEQSNIDFLGFHP